MNEELNDKSRGMHVLVVEDEPLVTMELVDDLERAGAIPVGPAASVEGALELIEGNLVHGAILDVQLQKKLVYPVADLLTKRGVPFILTTGYDAKVLPERFADVPNCIKPMPATEVLAILAGRMDGMGKPDAP